MKKYNHILLALFIFAAVGCSQNWIGDVVKPQTPAQSIYAAESLVTALIRQNTRLMASGSISVSEAMTYQDALEKAGKDLDLARAILPTNESGALATLNAVNQALMRIEADLKAHKQGEE